jgi:hypothetical protein
VPSYRHDPRQRTAARPWHARAKRGITEWSLGYYATREEALEVEEKFNRDNPRRINQLGRHQRISA